MVDSEFPRSCLTLRGGTGSTPEPWMSDEEVLLRVLMAGHDVDAISAADHPIVPIRPWARDELRWLREVVGDKRSRRVSASYGDITVDLARR